MSTVKVIELIGSSARSWEEAAANAVREAAETVSDIVGVEVTAQTAKVSGDHITEFRTTVKVAFKVKSQR
ncbi:MAG: dodecin domain-containing protein [Candidatus Aminicenantes bacterium]|jgi:flavin-binding protein dodecin|nr:dodecin domain-containing protein [Candidatus Aminicenantes bacterium]